MRELFINSPSPEKRLKNLVRMFAYLAIFTLGGGLVSSCQAYADEKPRAAKQLDLPFGVYSNETPVMCTDPSDNKSLMLGSNNAETTLGGRYFSGGSSKKPEIYVTSNVCDYHDSGKSSNLFAEFENNDGTKTRIPMQVIAIHVIAHEKAHGELFDAAELSTVSGGIVEYKGGRFSIDKEKESSAECIALQNVAEILRQYGYNEKEVEEYTYFLQTRTFLNTLPEGYTSPKCRRGGEMDLDLPDSYLK